MDYDYQLESPPRMYDDALQNFEPETAVSCSQSDQNGGAHDITAPYPLVYGLSMNVDIHTLRQEFEKYGEVLSCKFQSHGFYGYINMRSLESAKKVVKQLDGKYLGEYGCAMQLRQTGPPPMKDTYDHKQLDGHEGSWQRKYENKTRGWQSMRYRWRSSYRYRKSGRRPAWISGQRRWYRS